MREKTFYTFRAVRVFHVLTLSEIFNAVKQCLEKTKQNKMKNERICYLEMLGFFSHQNYEDRCTDVTKLYISNMPITKKEKKEKVQSHSS